MTDKQRVDILLMEQGLAESREKAQALILAGKVLCGDVLLEKPGQKLSIDAVLRIRGKTDHYVSRGAHKLLGALRAFNIDLKHKICLDVGASTGGFTQVCLEAGATLVYAVDVGTNQLDYKIRKNPQVVVLEGVNIRHAPIDLLPQKVDFACVDTSFISLKLVLPSVVSFLKPKANVVALIKPQHEVGKGNVGKGGVVRDPVLHQKVNEEIKTFSQSIGLDVLGLIESPIKGTTGNREFLIHLCKSS